MVYIALIKSRNYFWSVLYVNSMKLSSTKLYIYLFISNIHLHAHKKAQDQMCSRRRRKKQTVYLVNLFILNIKFNDLNSN